MGPSGHPEVDAVFDDLDAVLARVRALPVDALNVHQQLAMLERSEKVRWQLPAIEHPVINTLGRQATAEELGGSLPHAIAEATLISRAEASRRVKEAVDLGVLGQQVGHSRLVGGSPLSALWRR